MKPSGPTSGLSKEGVNASEILSVFVKTTSSTAVSFVLRAITAKIFALVLGPAGIGLFGLIRQIIDLCNLLSTAGGGTAVVQAVSSAGAGEQVQSVRTSAVLFVLFSVVMAVLFFFFGAPIVYSMAGVSAKDTANVVPLIAAVVMATSFSTFFGAVANAQGQYSRITLATALGSLAMMLVAYPVAVMAARGSVALYVMTQALPPLIMIALTYRAARFGGAYFWSVGAVRTAFDRRAALKILRVSAWLLLTSAISAVSALAVRMMVFARMDLDFVGQFTAAQVMAGIFFGFIIAPVQIYYLPQFSAARRSDETCALLNQFLSFAVLMTVPPLIGFLALKPLVVQALYSREFLPSLALLDWFLPTIFLQAPLWIIGTALIGVRRADRVVVVDIIQYGGFALLIGITLYVFSAPNLIGPSFTVAEAVACFACFCFARRIFGFMPSVSVMVRLAVGGAMVMGSAYVTVGQSEVEWFSACGLVLSGTTLSLLIASPQERSALMGFVSTSIIGRFAPR
jgi:O-antigen/teichoic acid export membrane protein